MKDLLKSFNEEMINKIVKDCSGFSDSVKDCAPAGIVVGLLSGTLITICGALNTMKNK